MINRISAADAALHTPIRETLAVVDDPAALEIVHGLLQLNAAGLRVVAEFIERMAIDEATDAERQSLIEMAKIVRRMGDSLAEAENCHG